MTDRASAYEIYSKTLIDVKIKLFWDELLIISDWSDKGCKNSLSLQHWQKTLKM